MRTPTRVIGSLLVAALFTQLSACGTLFYPERRGQIEGRIDPAVAAMNAIGILFFVLPGLIAFAIDFTTGAIYLPGGMTSQVDPQDLHKLVDADGKVDMLQLQVLIEVNTGQRLPLNDPRLIQHSGSAEQLTAYGLRPAA